MMKLLGITLSQPLRAVVVTTKDGITIRGAMVHADRAMVLLRSAAVGSDDPQTGLKWQKMQGDIVIPLDNVSYWQEGLDASLLDD